VATAVGREARTGAVDRASRRRVVGVG